MPRRFLFGARNASIAFLLFGLFFGSGCSRKSSAQTDTSPLWEEFSGANALQHVQRLVDFGPRPPGSDAIRKPRDYIASQLEQFGWTVRRQTFTDDTPRGKMEFVNLIGRFGSSENPKTPLFLLCSHYDTKIFDSIRFVWGNDVGS